MHTNPHPIEDSVRTRIESELRVVESQYKVQILFACESGSRGWGFASTDSDYDVRFVYVHPLPWYLRVTPARDVIEMPISEDLDIGGWELRKTLGLLKKGNATVLEWLDSPVIYRADMDFLAAIRSASEQVHRPERSFHHYIHMARGNYREYLHGDPVRLKKYLYVLRPILAAIWIERYRSIAPMRFNDLLDRIVDDPTLRQEIDRLLELKRSVREAEWSPRLPTINAFIESELTRLEATQPMKTEEVDFSVLDRLLFMSVLGDHG